MIEKCKTVLKSQKGQGLAEYGLIIALIAVVAIGALLALGPSIADKFFEVQTEIENATPAGGGGGGGGM
jgi:pilus assembly protein Flp/PilA